MAKKKATKAKSRQRAKPCLHCSARAVTRGTCSACYRKIRRDIADGKYSDKQAVKSERLLPASKGGRPAKRDRVMPPIVK